MKFESDSGPFPNSGCVPRIPSSPEFPGLPAAAGFALSLVKRMRSLAFALIGLGILALVAEPSGVGDKDRSSIGW
jgi:hypothetical protein